MATMMRRAAVAAGRVAGQQRRNMSGHGSPEEIYQNKEMWLKTTVGMTVGLIVPYTAFTIYKELTHEHKEHVDYPHMKVRHKAFPWAASDCDFFDLPCHKAFRAGVPYQRGHHGEHHGEHH